MGNSCVLARRVRQDGGRMSLRHARWSTCALSQRPLFTVSTTGSQQVAAVSGSALISTVLQPGATPVGAQAATLTLTLKGRVRRSGC